MAGTVSSEDGEKPTITRQRGEPVRRLVAILVAAMFCVTAFVRRVATLDRDPNWSPPWELRNTQSRGEEGG